MNKYSIVYYAQDIGLWRFKTIYPQWRE